MVIKSEQIVLRGEPFIYVDPKTGHVSFAGTAVAMVLGGSSEASGQSLVLESWRGEGLVEWTSGYNLYSLGSKEGRELLENGRQPFSGGGMIYGPEF